MCGSAAAALAGCKPGAEQAAAQDAPPPLAALPLTDASAPQAQPGPVAIDLPYARAARLGPLLDAGDGYAYLDRAYYLNDAFDEAPPDYGFDYTGEEMPWAWRTDDGFVRIVEFLPYGARYYYFEPDEDYPFLISDPDYDYAFADGDLVAVYDSSGSLLPPEDLALRAPLAGRELARAEGIYRASGRDQQPVALASWTAKRNQIASDVTRWRGLESHQPAWRTYHREHLASEQAHFAPERFRRAAETVRLDRQLHDPDGADHAMRQAQQAQDVARRAHVTIAMLPHRAQSGGQSAPRSVLAASSAAPGRGPVSMREDRRLAMAAGPPVGQVAPQTEPRGLRVERTPDNRLASARAARSQRLAMAQTSAEPRALYNFHDRAAERGPAAFAAPRLRAAEPVLAPAPDRTAARQMAARTFQPHIQAPPAQHAEPPHLQIAQAAPRAGGFSPPRPNAGAPAVASRPNPPRPKPADDRRH